MLQEKEEALLRMEEDIERLQVVDRENERKAILIKELEEKLNKMKQHAEVGVPARPNCKINFSLLNYRLVFCLGYKLKSKWKAQMAEW